MTSSVERYEKALAVLDEYIRKHNMRHTFEREEVLRVISKISNPLFTIHDLERRCDEVRIARSTLYNSLNLFVSARILYRIERTMGINTEQYKWALGAKNTMRLICTRCGRESRFSDEAIMRLIRDRNYSNFSPIHFSLYVYGECKRCRRMDITGYEPDKQNR